MSSRGLVTAVLAGACVFAASGCERSHVKADANVRLSGTVLSPSGRPAPDIRVALLKRPDAGEVIGGLTEGLATLGLVCAADSPPSICRSARRTITASDGSFAYRLRGSDTQGSVGNADTLAVTASAPGPGAATTTASFRVQHVHVALPALRLWDARLTFATPSMTPHWQPLPGESTLIFSADDGTPVWQQPHAGSGSPFDARVLEDAAVGARVETDTSVDRRSGSYDVQYLSSETHVTGTAGAPISRGAPCITPRAHGVRGVAGAPCWLTDGDLSARPPVTMKRHSAAVIDLGSSKPIALVVARGEPVSRAISVSSDGRHFQLLGTQTGAFVRLAPDGVRARYVRLKTAGGVTGTRELSVWDDPLHP